MARRLAAPCRRSPFALSVAVPAQLPAQFRRQKRHVEQKTLRENYLP